MNFWSWFARGTGTGSQPGWRRLVSPALILHLVVGVLAAFAISVEPNKAAQVVLIPLSGVFVGLTFAWVANVQTVLQSEEIAAISRFKEGGYADYVFTFQLGMLIVLSAIVLWGMAGLEVFEPQCARLTSHPTECVLAVKAGLFGSVSLAIRECWQLISASMVMMVVRQAVKEAQTGR